MFTLDNIRNAFAPRHSPGGSIPYTFYPTKQPQPGAEANAFESNQAFPLFFVWGNGTLHGNAPNPFGVPAGYQGNAVLYYNYAVPINGLGGLVTGQLVHVPLDNLNGDDTGLM